MGGTLRVAWCADYAQHAPECCEWRGRSSLERVVQLVAETPAQLYRLWPRKGNLQPGADADIVLVDMKGKQTLSNDAMLSRSAWTPYDGVKVQGFPVATYVRGQLARIMHKFSTVAPKPSALTALHSRGLLDVPYSTPAVPSVARLVRTAFSTPRYKNLCIIRASGK